MSRRGLVVLVIALVVLGALAFFGQRARSPAAIAEGGAIVPGLQAALNDIDRVTIKKAGGETVATIEKHASGWTVAEKNGYPADVTKLRQNLRALAEAKILETKTANPAFYDKLGVVDITDAKATGLAITIAASGKDLGTLILGDAKGTKQRYARRANEAQSYLIDRDPSLPKTAAQWLDGGIVDVRGNRVKQVTIKHPDGETVTISKPSADAANFDVAGIPKGRELLYPGVANVIGNALRELNLEDVERADDTAPDKPVQVEYRTFDGLIVRVTGAKRGDDAWISVVAGVDAEQAAQAQAAAKPAEPHAAAAPGGGAEQSAGDGQPATPPATSRSAPAAKPAAAPPQPDPTAEAQQINARVSAWRYKLAAFQYDQMTRRMNDLLKPAG
jgi:cell division septation protein DedD